MSDNAHKDKEKPLSSTATSAADMELDLTGLKCPLPVLKARRQLGQMQAGMVLVVTADDPAAPLDFEHFCSTNGHVLADSRAVDGHFIFRLIAGPHTAK